MFVAVFHLLIFGLDIFEPYYDFDTTHDSGCHISTQTCYLRSYIFPVKRTLRANIIISASDNKISGVRKVISKILRRKGFQ